jgi:hypothetical protein
LIAAEDDALLGRDGEFATKDALIEHPEKRAEDAETRTHHALRYNREFDQGGTRNSSAGSRPRIG